MALYSDPVLDVLIARLDATGPVKLRGKYYQGDPVLIPTSIQYPVCFVSRDTTRIEIRTTTEDMHTMPIVLNVVYNGAKELNTKACAQAGALALYDICEGRDNTYSLKSDTIAGVLRNTQVLDGDHNLFIDIEGSETTIEYALSPPERRQIWSVEAIIRTTIKHLEVR
jgi:hypothetical protein